MSETDAVQEILESSRVVAELEVRYIALNI